MQKLLTLTSSLCILAALAVGFSSCKDDEEKPTPVTIEFSSTAKTVAEGETNVKATIVLDRPAPNDLIVEYDIRGTATRKVGSGTGDFSIAGDVGEIEIAKGATSGEIILNILDDTSLEQDETIILEIVDVSGGDAQIGTDDQMTITIAGGGSVTASFAATTLAVKESDEGIHEIVVNLDAAASFDVTVTYSIKSWLNGGNVVAGVAIDSLSGSEEDLPSDYWDYFVDAAKVGELVIPAGQTSGIIGINIYSDFLYERNDETIEITLNPSTGVTVGTNAKMTVTISQEDGQIVELFWDETVGADMDMAIWVVAADDNGDPAYFPVVLSVNASTNGLEQRIIPNVFSDVLLEELEATKLLYGASYIYYSGGSDPLDFGAAFVEIQNKVGTVIDEFSATYTSANKNEWDEQEDGIFSAAIVQTFEYSGGTLTNISDIEVPASGSRVRSAEFKGLVKRNKIPFPLTRFK